MNKRLFLISIVLISAFFINSSTFSAQNQPDINQSLLLAIAEQPVDVIKDLLSGGANVNTTNELGWTPLHAAVRFGRGDVIPVLIEYGANINSQDPSGNTPLHLAIEGGNSNTVDLLLENGADVNIANNNRDNSLSLAQKIGQLTIAETLIQHGATPQNAQNQGGQGLGPYFKCGMNGHLAQQCPNKLSAPGAGGQS